MEYRNEVRTRLIFSTPRNTTKLGFEFFVIITAFKDSPNILKNTNPIQTHQSQLHAKIRWSVQIVIRYLLWKFWITMLPTRLFSRYSHILMLEIFYSNQLKYLEKEMDHFARNSLWAFLVKISKFSTYTLRIILISNPIKRKRMDSVVDKYSIDSSCKHFWILWILRIWDRYSNTLWMSTLSNSKKQKRNCSL